MDNLVNPLTAGNSTATSDTSIHDQVQAAMSIISIGFGGAMSLMGIWVRSNKSWNFMAIIGFVAWAAMTIYAGYETEWHRQATMGTAGYTEKPVWFIFFGWLGAVCYFIAFSLAIVADQSFKGLPDNVSATTSNLRNHLNN